MAEPTRTKLSVKQEKAVLVGVILPGSTADPRDPLGELASLAKTAGAKVVATVLQKRHKVDAGTYIGTGKAEEVADLAIKHKADVVIFDNDLSPGQIGALERLINKHADSPRGKGIKVLDRSELILEFLPPAPNPRSQVAGGTGPDAIHLPALGPHVGPPGTHRRRRHRPASAHAAPANSSWKSTAAWSANASADLNDEIERIQARKSRAGSPAQRQRISPSASWATPTPEKARCSTR